MVSRAYFLLEKNKQTKKIQSKIASCPSVVSEKFPVV